MPFFNLLGGADEPDIATSKVVHNCETCGLYNHARSPKLRFTGKGGKGVLVIGEQPSREEDRFGEYGHGEEYNFIANALESRGYSMERDCYYTTAINCKPTKDRPPKGEEIKACNNRIATLIGRLKPTSIITVGDVATTSLIQPRLTGRITSVQMMDFAGDNIPDQFYKTWISPVWSVASMFEKKAYSDGTSSKMLFERDEAYYNMWCNHLDKAMSLGAMTIADYRDQCVTTTDMDKAIGYIQKAIDTWSVVAFDYETTGIKPHRKGHKIWYASISDGYGSYAFPFFDDPKFLKAWKELMLSDVKKVAHNLAYETMWTHALLGYYPANWYWDTMLGQHSLANQKPSGLKYLVYSVFGHSGYDDEVDSYLKASKEEVGKYGDNAINRIHEAPVEPTLLYNALDSLYTYKLYEYQKSTMSDFQQKGLKLFVEGMQVLVDMQENGFNIDMDEFERVSRQLDESMREVENRILTAPVLEQWEGTFNHQSSVQLGKLLYEILKLPVKATTDSGKPSVDVETLEQINVPIVKDILEFRKLAKLKKTYLSQYAREAVDNRIHPFYYLHKVDTYRSSSASPNVQNQPKRDKGAKELIRSCIRPSKGNKIVEYDYKSLEVVVNGAYSKDPTLAKYILDPSSDMHRDSAADCFILKPEEVTKALRGDVKGQFVFAEFYGSYYAQVAKDLWETAHTHNLVEHLTLHGIKRYDDFEAHIKEAERILWEERFPKHDEWRKNQWKFYQKHGYVELKTGFRAYGPMGRNNSFNTPIQGSGFHILLQTLIWVSKKMQTLERSKIIGEIHDSIIMDVHPSEEAMIDYWVWWYGTQKIREYWDWITVPLTIEKESSEVDGSWAKMKEAGTLKGDTAW